MLEPAPSQSSNQFPKRRLRTKRVQRNVGGNRRSRFFDFNLFAVIQIKKSAVVFNRAKKRGRKLELIDVGFQMIGTDCWKKYIAAMAVRNAGLDHFAGVCIY